LTIHVGSENMAHRSLTSQLGRHLPVGTRNVHYVVNCDTVPGPEGTCRTADVSPAGLCEQHRARPPGCVRAPEHPRTPG